MEKKNLHSLDVNGKKCQLTHGVSLLEGLLGAEVNIHHSCGGNATCGTCLVEVLENVPSLPARNELEQEMATDRGFRPQERLACQLEVCGPLKIRTLS